MSVIEDGEAHASISPGCGAECRERILVLTSGLANRGTDHNFIDLVLAQACLPQRADIRIGDHPCVVCDLIHECAHGLREPLVVEGRAADLRRRLTFPLEDSRNEGTVQ